MAGDWIKMRTDLADDPIVYRLAVLTKLDRLSVVGRIFAFWAWADKHAVDGRVDGATSTVVDDVVRFDGFSQALSDVKWLEIGPDFVAIPKHDRHNGASAKERGLKNKRQANWREGNKNQSDAGIPSTQPSTGASTRSSTTPSTREEKRREDINSKALSGKPDVGRQDVGRSGNDNHGVTARQVIAFLNEKAQRRYQANRVNLGFIIARLNDGATEVECRQVIAKKVREWGNDPKMAEYLRPATLFNATKFSQYQGELVAPAPDVSRATSRNSEPAVIEQ